MPALIGLRWSHYSGGPSGLPIPHTGIVPSNKERTGTALGRFITNNFLTAGVLSNKWLFWRRSLQETGSWLADSRSINVRLIAGEQLPESGRA